MQNCKIKKHYKTRYTQIDNMLVNDMGLSFQAKGLFLYIWSKPDDWQVNVKAMQYNCVDKQTKIYSALKELQTRGYLIRKRYYENGKVAGINYNFSDTKEFFFNQDELNQEILNEVELNEENPNEYIYIQKKDNIKERQYKRKINTKDTASGFSSSQSNYSEISNSSVCKESLHTQKQKNEEFNQFWEEYGKKVKKPKAEESFKKALSKASFEEIMHGVKEYQRYLKVANEKKQWLGKSEPHKWLNEKRWNDDYNDLIKQEYKKQGKPLPVQQKPPEKQQEEVKMKEDKQKKRESVLKHLNSDETQFMNDIKEVLKSYFQELHKPWIDDFVFSCRNKVAYFEFTEQKHIDTVNRNFEKFEQIIRREIASTELAKEEESLKIELKLID
jgi:hypothetical protein